MRKNKYNETNLPLTISSKDGLVDQISFFNKTVASKDMSGYYLLLNGEFAYNKSYSAGYDFGSIKRLDRYPMGALSTLYICFALTKHNSNYIKTYFDSLKWYKEIYMISAEGARNHGLLNVPTEEFFDTHHYLSGNPHEQSKIAQLMDLLEQRIQKQQELVDNLKKYKRGAINAFFNQNDGATYKCVLGEIGEIIRGLSYDKFDVVNDDSATVVLRSNNIQGGFLDYRNDLQFVKKSPAKEQVLQKGDIVICMANGSAALVGKAACFDGDDSRVLTVGAFCGIYRCENEIIEYYFQSDKYIYALRKMQQGGDGAIGNLKPSSIESLEVWLPTEEEQKVAFKFFKSIDLKIHATEKTLSLLMKMKRGLLNSLFI